MMKQNVITVLGVALLSFACTDHHQSTEPGTTKLNNTNNKQEVYFYEAEEIRENSENAGILYQDTNKHKDTCIPDSNMFLLRRINGTISRDEVLKVKRFKNLNQTQINAWIMPIPNRNDYIIESAMEQHKAVSFQNKAKNYYSILLMQVDNITKEYVMGEQFLVTVDNSGKYIDCLPVSYIKNLSNSEVELDTTRNLYKFSTNTKSLFNGDTVKVMQLSSVSNMLDSHEEKDYWEELYETIYFIQSDGKIMMIGERKKIKDSRDK